MQLTCLRQVLSTVLEIKELEAQLEEAHTRLEDAHRRHDEAHQKMEVLQPRLSSELFSHPDVTLSILARLRPGEGAKLPMAAYVCRSFFGHLLTARCVQLCMHLCLASTSHLPMHPSDARRSGLLKSDILCVSAGGGRDCGHTVICTKQGVFTCGGGEYQLPGLSVDYW